ncbi:4-hydroxythreonine-4-phosphate dehydrogenase PdxA [bacterium]
MLELKKVVLFTIGEPSGIGPEISIKTALDLQVLAKCNPVLIGNIKILEKTLANLNLSNIKFNLIQDFQNITTEALRINVYSPDNFSYINFEYGTPTIETGKASFDYLQTAVKLIKKGESNYLVTAPISKNAWQKAGIDYLGHTEALADMTGTVKYGMIFVNPLIKVILATRHLALKRVSEILTKDIVKEAIDLAIEFLDGLGICRKRIGICSLNPHGGDQGTIGSEEIDVISPVVDRYKQVEGEFIGPSTCDAIYNMALNKQIDLVVAMYHDQGIMPLKLLAYHKCVNITYGLPFVRTSPGHGTAFDISGKNIANEDAMIEAVNWALKLG